MTMEIMLDFGSFSCEAELFDTPVAESFFNSLPQTVSLTKWGKEAYGSVKGNHGHHNPQGAIPMGGLAYTERGSYFCVFWGQSPAWPVEHIGQIVEEDIAKVGANVLDEVVVQRKK